MRRALTVLAAVIPLAAADGALAMTTLGGGSFGAGLTGPLVALPILLGLVGLGLWAAEQGGKAAWQLPAAALAAMVILGLLHQSGMRVPYAGLVMEGSLVVLGGLVALGVILPSVVGLVLAVVAAGAFGVAMAGWAGAVGVPLLFWLGAALGGLLLASAGVGLSTVIAQALSPGAVRAAGAALALTGVLMLLGIV